MYGSIYLVIVTRKKVFGYLSLECLKERINYQWLDLLSLGNAVMRMPTLLQHLISLMKPKKAEFISSFTIPYLCSKDLIKNYHRSVGIHIQTSSKEYTCILYVLLNSLVSECSNNLSEYIVYKEVWLVVLLTCPENVVSNLHTWQSIRLI